MQKHARAVSAIAEQVQSFHDRGLPFRISHGSTNSTRPSTRIASQIIDTSALRHVLSIDTEKKTCVVQPNVPMDKLVDYTLKYGLQPAVTPEFPGITTGGMYNGTCGESSSFKYGFTDRNINWVELVLADGQVVKASEQERRDLFEGAAEALGTFGVTTSLELRLIEAKKYVETTYIPVTSISEAVTKIQELTKDLTLDYVDGILFSENHGVLVTGRMRDDNPSSLPVRSFSQPWDPWFYVHAQSLSKPPSVGTTSSSPATELIPIYDYLFRYDRGGFWVGRSAFSYMLNFPFNRYTRWFLDDLLHTRFLYKALHASAFSDSYIVQDLALPYESSEQFIKYTKDRFSIWPLWLCPLKQKPGPTRRGAQIADEPHLNIGLWGFPPSQESARTLNLDLEQKLQELNGIKWLYAQQFHSKTAFWSQYDKASYDALRQRYQATMLPSVYDKVKRGVDAPKTWWTWLISLRPLAGLYGIVHGTLYGEHGKKVTQRGAWKSIDINHDESLAR